MLILGLLLLVIGYFLGIGLLETIGLILAVLGAIFWIAAASGRPVGGRTWY